MVRAGIRAEDRCSPSFTLPVGTRTLNGCQAGVGERAQAVGLFPERNINPPKPG